MARRVTLADVSREAGVGIATVSRALSPQTHPDVSAETRARVRDVADRLGYRPSVTARAMRSQSFHAISVILPDGLWGWWEPAVQGAYAAASRAGYHTLVQPFATVGGDGITAGSVHQVGRSDAASVIAGLRDVPTEGVIIFGSADDEDAKDAAARLRLPMVAIDDAADSVHLPTIATDNFGGAVLAVRHLIEHGRRRIAYVASDYDLLYMRERQAGYRHALRDSGIAYDPDLVIVCRDTGDEDLRTYPEFARFLTSAPDIDAVFCEADELAAPVLRSLRAAGRSVPQDVSVIGFDDERAARLLDPPLSTVRQSYEDLGELAVSKLLRAIDGEAESATRTLVAPRLVVRGSTSLKR